MIKVPINATDKTPQYKIKYYSEHDLQIDSEGKNFSTVQNNWPFNLLQIQLIR